MSVAQRVELARLQASDGAPGDAFGSSLAVDGDTLVVGAPHHDPYGSAIQFADIGAAYVFVRSGTSWVQQAKLLPADGTSLRQASRFGTSVAIDGDTIVVGTPSSQTPATGAAYVFVRSSGIWTQQAKLINTGYSDFGASVAVDGDTLAVGAFRATLNPFFPTTGAVVVYSRAGVTWTQSFLLAGGNAGGGYGYSLALDNDVLLIGAPYEQRSGSTSRIGAAYFSTRSGSSWSGGPRVFASDASASALFGFSVAIEGGLALIGAAEETNSGFTRAGSTYAFAQNGTTWAETQKILPSDPAATRRFGASVALEGDRCVVGASLVPSPGPNDSKGYLSARLLGSYIEETTLVANAGTGSEALGQSCGIAGDEVFLGAPGLPGNTTYSGQVFVYAASTSNTLPNDECAGATPVVLGDNGPFDSQGATTSAPGFTCGNSGGADLWHVWVADGNADAVIETCSSSFDTVLEIYDGTCGSLVSLDCDDDSCSTQSRAQFVATGSHTYYIRVGGVGGATGNYAIRVTLTGQIGSFQTVETSCGAIELTASGLPTIGGSVSYEVTSIAGAAMIWFGAPLTPMAICPPLPCALGADVAIAGTTTSVQFAIPLDASIVGGVLACQAAEVVSAPGTCPQGEAFQLRFTDTIVTTIL